ncbi:hypothetical protein [Candidatus Methanocrinis natronophilus]|uniref:Uncharacterized protein n=1 Tax=Candidatus Methanocrinis natronophilus TaxID=3033396 RepID=A0ABT5X5V8_9EURY|nr:hypothetical protein [Candidatus Methanocrinis natronophilus]MDF0590077.1 hypothetical protein [Candidatus Methanocrinis natronophilus]
MRIIGSLRRLGVVDGLGGCPYVRGPLQQPGQHLCPEALLTGLCSTDQPPISRR